MSLTINQVSKVYGKKVALNQLSLELEDGKIYGLIGRNGAGKTTLLQVHKMQQQTEKFFWMGKRFGKMMKH